jgi:hypothetical protein
MNSKAIVFISAVTIILAAFCGCGRYHNAIKLPEPSPQILSDLEFFTYDEVVTWIKSNPNLIHHWFLSISGICFCPPTMCFFQIPASGGVFV